MDAQPGPLDAPAAPTVGSLWSDVSGLELADELLEWPADVFALAGTILRRTHAYRFAVSPPVGRRWPPRPHWNDVVSDAAEHWCGWVDEPDGEPPPLLTDAWAVLRKEAGTPVAEVRDGRSWALVEALLTMLSVSDEASAGLAGTIGPVRASGSRHRGRATELLARTGSLSRLPTHRLRVLPKVRTPPSGISFRSLSRYLCLRDASVDVSWHKAPARKAGSRQQNSNVLLLPWPLRIRTRDFRPRPGSVQRSENEPFGTFDFDPAEPFDVDLVERAVLSALDEVDVLDAVVFPESCVPAEALQPLEAVLARHGVTVLLAGAREKAADPMRQPANWVHLGVHVGGCWSHYRQNKHHRWFLDESQITQYQLGGALHPAVRWWEAMEVPPRSLQVLELGEGLTLVAVICEDLARLDEVAELLRDIGPTLVVTILLDGPQLASRWTARYASVLADDPGSSVLTLSAAGMVHRSRPPGLPPSSVIALWKDATRGLREIELAPGATGVLMSMASTRARRRAADGRTPMDNATGLTVAGVHQVVTGGTPRSGGLAPAVTGAALGPEELTIASSWADAVAAALTDEAPDRLDAILADAAPGAPWRRRLGLPEPSEALTRAIAALGEAATDVPPNGGGRRDVRVLSALYGAGSEGEPPVPLAHAVLARALEARVDLGAVHRPAR
jgi:hypothetical protein